MAAQSKFEKEEDAYILSDLLPIFVEGQAERKVARARQDCVTKFRVKFPIPPDLSESEAGIRDHERTTVRQING